MIRDSILTTNVFRPMTRNLLLLFTVALAACGKAPTVSVFTAAPVTIAKGSSSTLVFAAEGAEQLTLEPGGGNVTGKTQLVVSPTETTTYTLKASNDSGETTQSLTVTVGPTPAAGFKLTAAGPFTAGTPANVTVTAVDPSGATVPAYTGTVHLVSNDGAAELPADFTFSAADKGVKTVPVTFRTSGPRLLVASGTVGGDMKGTFSTTSEPFTVKAGPAHTMRLSDLPAESESGAEVSFQVSFVDAFGNAAREYTTVLSVQSSDETAPAVPAVNLVEANQGLATVRLTFFKAGVQSVTVQDTQKASVKASAEFRVRPGTAVAYAFSPLPATARAGEPVALTLTALDARGNRAHAYSGTARITSADTALQPTADAVFSQGVAHVSVAFRTPGNQTVTATEVGGTLTKTSNTVKVTPADAMRIVLSGTGPATAGGSATFTATVQDTFGNTVTDYQGTVGFSSTDSRVVLPSAYTFTEQDMGTRSFSATFKTAGMQTLTVADTARAGVIASAPFMVKAGPAHAMRLSNLPAESESDTEVSFQVSFVDAFGNAAQEYTTVLSVQHSDETAPVVPAVTLVEANQGLATVRLTFFKAGVQTITVQDTQKASVNASAELRVRPGTAVAYALSPLPDAARVGEPLALTLTALDARGNRAQAYSGTARISTTDTAMKPLANVVFSQGVAHVSVAFRTPGNQTVTATEVGGTLTKTSNAVKVTSAEATRIVLSGAGPATAGGSATFTATVQDAFGHTVTDYQGTVSFSSTDPSVVLPAAYTFTEQDMGTRSFSATFKTAGAQTLTVADTVRAGVTGSVGFNVSAAAASGCAISDVPSTTTAGTQFPVRVTVRDEFSNTAIGYGGTVTLTSTDAHASASLPEATAFVPAADQGSRVFGAKLVSANTQTITAADATGGWSCMATVRITPATPRIQVALPTDANAGYPVTALVSVKDVYGNAISQTGSLSFTSTDAAATLPATVALDESGSATVSATFKTLGAQQLKAALATDASVSGTGTISVHGLVYTNPQPGVGKVRLVVNQAASSASVVQLDLVSNTTLTATGSATIPARGGAYSAGMNLPLNTSRVEADTTLLVAGNALNLGAAPRAVAAALPTSGPTAGVLYTGVSQKIDGAGKVAGDVGVLPGFVYYSVRLKLPASATVGAVFDGVSLDQRFRAAVRGRGGDEVLSSADFSIGKLEVR